jgi:hypothetical protein
MSDVLEGNVTQVYFKGVGSLVRGLFRVLTDTQLMDLFTDGCWVMQDSRVTNVGEAFQIIQHHYVRSCGGVEAFYLTIHPIF